MNNQYSKSPQPCFKCKNHPSLLTKEFGRDLLYYFYSCQNCNISTFSTREEIFCRELWNAAVEYLEKKSKK